MELAVRSISEPVVFRLEMTQNNMELGWGLLEYGHRTPYYQSSQVNRSGGSLGVYTSTKFPSGSGGMLHLSSYSQAQTATWRKISKAFVLFRGREE